MELFGSTRSVVERDHALICPDSFVRSPLPGWTGTQGILHIAPAMGARFTMYQALMEPGAHAGPPLPGIERFVYVLEGHLTHTQQGSQTAQLLPGLFAFIPTNQPTSLVALAASRIVVFEKRYEPLSGVPAPPPVRAKESDFAGIPFMGNPKALLQTFLSDGPPFDLAVNRFRFQPGAALPLVEIHVMEHGLLMLEGQGIYRLGDRWYPVKAGDVIWMKSFCPQWFVAMGDTPAAYLYYKDVNRDPLGANV
jgi:(S)-ureidoglycine aminohydrolase